MSETGTQSYLRYQRRPIDKQNEIVDPVVIWYIFYRYTIMFLFSSASSSSPCPPSPSLPLLLLLPLYLGNVYAHFEKWAAATRQYWLYTYQSISWFYSIVIDNHLLWLTSLQYRLLFNSRFHCFALMDFKFCFFFTTTILTLSFFFECVRVGDCHFSNSHRLDKVVLTLQWRYLTWFNRH